MLDIYYSMLASKFECFPLSLYRALLLKKINNIV